MWTIIITILSISGCSLGAAVFQCPEETTCVESGSVKANSFQFLEKLKPKQYLTIMKLEVVNASLTKLPAELKYMKELQYLDLSNNEIQIDLIPSLSPLKTLKLSKNSIKHVRFSLLPKYLKELDLAGNFITDIPKDWAALQHLKTLHLQKNPIDCDCYNNNVLRYRSMVKQGVKFPQTVTCYLPKHVAGKDINSINCTSEDEMINDAAIESSGDGEDISNPVVPYLNEYNAIEENELIDDHNDLPVGDDAITPEEGSGDEGSGFVAVEFDHVSACLFNCSAPEPVGSQDEKNDANEAPGPTDQLKIIAQDVFNPIFDEPATSTTTTTSEPSPITTTTISSPTEVSEEPIRKDSQRTVFDQPSVNEAEVFSKETHTGQLEKATALNQNNYAVYLVVGSGLIIAVLFLVCFLKKRKNNRLNEKEHPGIEEEMKPLDKPKVQPPQEQNGKTKNNLPEHVPLLNKTPKDEPILMSYVPLEHPEIPNGVEEPVIRNKPQPELLTPPTERVTIRASEIPESVLKTPVLVHRLRNSQGEIITTMVPP